MPFNMAMMGIGGRTFVLANITAEDLAINYVVESELLAQFPTSGGSQAGDLIQLTVEGVNLIAANSGVYAIDGDSLHDDALFNITLESGAWISGRGGRGGNGGRGDWDFIEPEEPGFDNSTAGANGTLGGTAIRLGCETNIIGTGDIENGYGGGAGGGGGAVNPSTEHGGGGGGGGAPLGDGGNGGTGQDGSGSSGGNATQTADTGGGSAGGSEGGSGGRGGDTVAAAANGSNGSQSGGTAGAVGDAIDSQGFTNTQAGGITVTGNIA